MREWPLGVESKGPFQILRANPAGLGISLTVLGKVYPVGAQIKTLISDTASFPEAQRSWQPVTG